MGGPRGTRAKRFERGTPCKCTTLAWTAANACTAHHSFPPCNSSALQLNVWCPALAFIQCDPRCLAPQEVILRASRIGSIREAIPV